MEYGTGAMAGRMDMSIRAAFLEALHIPTSQSSESIGMKLSAKETPSSIPIPKQKLYSHASLRVDRAPARLCLTLDAMDNNVKRKVKRLKADVCETPALHLCRSIL
jgi:hypothetical protein